MVKNGLLRIGYIRNMREYAQDIKDKAGITYIDFSEFNSFVDSQWDNKFTSAICYNEHGEELSCDSDVIKFFLIDTGYRSNPTNDILYARFSRKDPGSLDSEGWTGVDIETKAEFLDVVQNNVYDDSSFDSYTHVGSFIPIARTMAELTQNNNFSEKDCRKLLQDSYTAARAEGTLAVVSNQYNNEKQISFFPLKGIASVMGKRLFVKMEKHKFPGTVKWFGAFVVTEDELKDELLSFYIFHTGYFTFESTAKVNSFYESLAAKAMRENWKWSDSAQNVTYSQPILKSYLEYTYYRLLDEDAIAEQKNKPAKIITENGKRYFNSGLLDRNFRQIIIVGDALDLQYDIPGLGECTWQMVANIKAFSHNEHEIARMFCEDELPGIASYFEDYRQVVFDASLDIHTNDNHIFEDGVARGRLPKYQEEYDKVKDNESEKDLLLARIARDFDSARDRAKLMAERNYKLAVPQFWKETGEIQFLLPIYLGEREEAEKPQCALVLSLDTSGRRSYYRGETILTLDMAYNNTRLIAKPDVFWLNDLV